MEVTDTLPGFPGFTCSAAGITDTVAGWMAEHDNYVTSQKADEEDMELRGTEASGEDLEPKNIVDDLPGTMMMPEVMLDSINKGDSAGFYAAKAAAASDLDAVYHQMAQYGERALQEWTSPTGQVVWASSAANATFYSYAREVKEKDVDGKEITKQIVQVGNYSASTGMTVQKEWKICTGIAKAVTRVVVSKLAWTFAKWIVNIAAKKIADTALWGVLVGFLEGGGFLSPTVKTVLRASGRVLSYASKAIFSGAAAFFASWGVELLMNYLGTKYCLILDIMNLSDKVDWTISEKEGQNEEIHEGEWKNATVPMKHKENNSIVGFAGETVSKATVYYTTYVFTQSAPLIGGFTVATSIVPSDNSEGIIVKYRVEKAADNSMGVAILKAGDKSAKNNYDSVDMKKEKSVSIDKPPVKLLADHLYNSANDVYKCQVVIGRWRARSGKTTGRGPM